MRPTLQDWPYANFSRGRGLAPREIGGLSNARPVDAATFDALVAGIRQAVQPGLVKAFGDIAPTFDPLVSAFRGDDQGAALSIVAQLPDVTGVLSQALAMGKHYTAAGVQGILGAVGKATWKRLLDVHGVALSMSAEGLTETFSRALEVLRGRGGLAPAPLLLCKRAVAQVVPNVGMAMEQLLETIEIFALGSAERFGVIKVDTNLYVAPTQGPQDVLRNVLDSPGQRVAVAELVKQPEGTMPRIPESLRPALEAYVVMYGGAIGDSATLHAFRRFVADRFKYKRRAGVLALTADMERGFLRARRGKQGGKARTTGAKVVPDAKKAPPTTVADPSKLRIATWIRADDLWDAPGDVGVAAFRRAAQAMRFEDAAIDMVMAEGSTYSFVHLDTGTRVTPASLAVLAQEGEFAVTSGGIISVHYSMPYTNYERLQIAKTVHRAGYDTIQAYIDDEAARARTKGFSETGMLPGSEAYFQATNWVGRQIAAGFRSQNGQFLINGLVDPSGAMKTWLGIDAGGAIGRGLSDGFLNVTQAVGNLQRMAHMLFITKPASFILGYNGGLPDGWGASYDEGGRRGEEAINASRRSYQAQEDSTIGQTIRVLAGTVPVAPVYVAAAAAPPILIFWNAGLYARRPIDELATGILVDSLGLMVGPTAGRLVKAVPVANALRPGGFETLVRYTAKNPSGVRAYLLVRSAADAGAGAASNLADENYRAAVEAIVAGTATEDQKRLVVGALLAGGIQATAAMVLTPVQDASEIEAFRQPPRERPKLVPKLPIFAVERQGRRQLSGVVTLPDGRLTYSLIDSDSPQVKNAIIRTTDAASVDLALLDARLRRVREVEVKKMFDAGLQVVLEGIKAEEKLDQAQAIKMPPPGGSLEGQQLLATGKDLNIDTGYANSILVAKTSTGEKVAVKVPRHATNAATASEMIAKEAQKVRDLEPYGGPKFRGLVEVKDPSGKVRKGLAMEIVDGQDMATLRGSRAEFKVTAKHIESMERLIKQLRDDGKYLDDFTPQNVMLTRDGRVVPVDSPLIDSAPTSYFGQDMLARIRGLAEPESPAVFKITPAAAKAKLDGLTFAEQFAAARDHLQNIDRLQEANNAATMKRIETHLVNGGTLQSLAVRDRNVLLHEALEGMLYDGTNYRQAHNEAMRLLGHKQWDLIEITPDKVVIEEVDHNGDTVQKVVPKTYAESNDAKIVYRGSAPPP